MASKFHEAVKLLPRNFLFSKLNSGPKPLKISTACRLQKPNGSNLPVKPNQPKEWNFKYYKPPQHIKTGVNARLPQFPVTIAVRWFVAWQIFFYVTFGGYYFSLLRFQNVTWYYLTGNLDIRDLFDVQVAMGGHAFFFPDGSLKPYAFGIDVSDDDALDEFLELQNEMNDRSQEDDDGYEDLKRRFAQVTEGEEDL